MASTVITVTGMTCSHCVNAVQAEIGKLTGVSDVAVDLDTSLVTPVVITSRCDQA